MELWESEKAIKEVGGRKNERCGAKKRGHPGLQKWCGGGGVG